MKISWRDRRIEMRFRARLPLCVGGGGCVWRWWFPWWLSDKESACQYRSHRRQGFDLWVGKILWRRKWQPTPGFLLGWSNGQRSLVGYSPSGITKNQTQLSEHTHTHSKMKHNKIINKWEIHTNSYNLQVREWPDYFVKPHKEIQKNLSVFALQTSWRSSQCAPITPDGAEGSLVQWTVHCLQSQPSAHPWQWKLHDREGSVNADQWWHRPWQMRASNGEEENDSLRVMRTKCFVLNSRKWCWECKCVLN